MEPVAKHDLLCNQPIHDAIINGSQPRAIDTLADFASTIQSSLASKSPSTACKLVSFYTYEDAPTNPKALCCQLSVDFLVKRSVFDNLTRDCVMRRCRVGVFSLHQCANKPDRRRNSEKFIAIVHYLRSNELVLCLPTDSAGRTCFVSPPRGEGSDSDCEAVMHFIYSSELLEQAQKNQRDEGMWQCFVLFLLIYCSQHTPNTRNKAAGRAVRGCAVSTESTRGDRGKSGAGTRGAGTGGRGGAQWQPTEAVGNEDIRW